MRDFFYIGIIALLIGFSASLLNFYTWPRDCEAAAMLGHLDGVKNTTQQFKRSMR